MCVFVLSKRLSFIAALTCVEILMHPVRMCFYMMPFKLNKELSLKRKGLQNQDVEKIYLKNFCNHLFDFTFCG